MAMKTETKPHLTRAFGLLPATALNIANMVGIGPFITIPLLMASMGGPQSMLGWLTGAFIVVSDGLIWSELGAALPGSGGSYHFLREAYGHESWGRLMAFLFIWQFVLSGPLEIASGMIGFGNYSTYLWPGLNGRGQQYVAVAVGLFALFLLCRKITFLSKVALTLCIGTVLAMVTIIVTGFPHFDAHRAFDFPRGAMTFNRGFVLGLGSATLIAVYNYLGYLRCVLYRRRSAESFLRSAALHFVFARNLLRGIFGAASRLDRSGAVAGRNSFELYRF